MDVWVSSNFANLAQQDGRTWRAANFSRSGVTTAEAAVLNPAISEAPILRKRRLILVLDDDPSMLKVIERALKVHGFEAELFSSVEDFENCADIRKASCLVLDINVNGECGIDLRRRIATAGVSIPAVFITGNDNPKARKAANETGCSAFLVKPFTVKSFIDAIAQAASEQGSK